MKSNAELKEIDIKDCTRYYFDDIIKIVDFYFDNFLFIDNSHGNILIYDISYKTLIGAKSLSIRFNKVDGYIM